ncbi:MAG TPA: hypothetical protein VKE93_06515 [Candidatus Angelobacter sp.]|nr:hypothetical protein [Candidatus Angelobacter sp.]
MSLADFKSAELVRVFAGSVVALSVGLWCFAATSLLRRAAQSWTLLEKLAVGALGGQFVLALMLFAFAVRSSRVDEVLSHGPLHIWTIEIFGFMTFVGLVCSILMRSDVGKKITPATMLWIAGIASVWALPGK